MATTKTAIHICSKEIEIALLQQELAHIRKDIAEIKEAVVGNGHPGLKERMDKGIQPRHQRQDLPNQT